MAGLQVDDVSYTAALKEVTRNEFELQSKGLIDSAKEEDDSESFKYDVDEIYPTEMEERTLRRIPDKVPWNAYRAHNILFGC